MALSEVETWRLCRSCSYSELHGAREETSACRRCGDPLWADEGQKRQMLRMRQVFATTSDRSSRIADDWAIITSFALPRPNLFVRTITSFLRNDDGTWRRDDERHENVLVDTATVPDLLAEHGVEARVAESFGQEALPAGLVAIVGRKADA